jgi:hypothetical protein
MAFGDAVVRLLGNSDLAARMGKEARERVRREFLDPRQLVEHVKLIAELVH